MCSSSSNSNNTHTTTRMQNTRNTRSRNAPRGEEFLGGGFLSHLEEEFASIDRELLNARKRMTMLEEEEEEEEEVTLARILDHLFRATERSKRRERFGKNVAVKTRTVTSTTWNR